MRWAFLIIVVCAVAMLWGVGPEYGLYVAGLVAFVNFATLCIQYDDPIKRAQRRAADLLGRLKPGGINADLYQRLQSATPKPTAEDRRVRYGPMTFLSIGSGIAGAGLLVWGVVLRFM